MAGGEEGIADLNLCDIRFFIILASATLLNAF